MVIDSLNHFGETGGNRTRLMDCSNTLHTRAFPENAIFILGAGRFGGRAAATLSSRRNAPIWLIDKEVEPLLRAEGLPVSTIQKDALEFLGDHFSSLGPGHIIVPSLPAHLAYQWLRRHHGGRISQGEIPPDLIPLFPHAWMGSEGSLLVSYADFLCPDDCQEPEDHCTVTGHHRGVPMHELLRTINISDHHTHVIRSRQLAPGVGGYRASELRNLVDELDRAQKGKWILGTACRCHGIITVFQYS